MRMVDAFRGKWPLERHLLQLPRPLSASDFGSAARTTRPILWRQAWLRLPHFPEHLSLTCSDAGSVIENRIGYRRSNASMAALQQVPTPRVEQLAADAVPARYRDRQYARLQALRRNLALLLDRPPAPLAARDHFSPLVAQSAGCERSYVASVPVSARSSSTTMDNTHHTPTAPRNVVTRHRLRIPQIKS
jgi:hypothetical protein